MISAREPDSGVSIHIASRWNQMELPEENVETGKGSELRQNSIDGSLVRLI